MEIWEKIHDELEQTAFENLNRDDGMISLVVAIIVSAGKDRDRDYLDSQRFEYDCELIKLNSETIRRLFQRVWSR